MNQQIVVHYARCYSHDQESHMIVNPTPQLLDQLRAQGLEPEPNGYLGVPEDCPACKREQRETLRLDVALAEFACDQSAVDKYNQMIDDLDLPARS